MSVIEHLEELRWRLIYSFIAIAVGAVIAYFVGFRFFDFLKYPLKGMTEVKFITTTPLEAFMVRLRLAGYGGLFLAFPVIFYQILAFIVPALRDVERRILYPLVFLFFILFMAGAAMGQLVVLPVAYRWLYAMGGNQFLPYWTASDIVAFAAHSLLAFGFSFEIPIVVLLLVKIRVLSIETLRKKRKYAYFLIFVVAELVAPDMITPFILLIPLLLLYEGSILLAKVF